MGAPEYAVYRYYVDWDGDDSFAEPDSDISAYVLRAAWSHGRPNGPPDRAPAGNITILLDNSDSRFSPYNTSSPYYGKVRPNLKVRVTMQVSGVVEVVVQAQGFLQTIIPSVGEVIGVSTAELTAYGPLSQFATGEFEVALQENIATGAAIVALLNGDDFPTAERSIDTGQETLSKWWVHKGNSRIDCIQELADAELGTIREGRAGELIFDDRSHAFSASPDSRAGAVQATYGTGTLRPWNLKELDSLPGIFNYVQANVRTFNNSETVTLITHCDVRNGQGGRPLLVPAGQTVAVVLEYPAPTSPAGYIAVQEWGLVTYEANTSEDATGTDITSDVAASRTELGPRLRLEFTNAGGSDAYLVVLSVQGTAIVESDPIPIESKDDTSIGLYRKRPYPYPSQWITDQVDGQAWLDYVVSLYKDPRPRLQFDVKANYDLTHLAEVQARDVGDRIHVTAGAWSGLYIDADFIIDSISHQVDEARLHTMTVVCTLAPPTELGPLGKAYTPKVISEESVPDDIYANAIDPFMKILFGAIARKNNGSIVEAEFRARLVSASENPDYVDLRTPAEGGDLVDDRDSSPSAPTMIIRTGLYADYEGVQFLYRPTVAGKWYYAWRFRNAKGWSNWSDGNTTPSHVTQYVLAQDLAAPDDGPPDDYDGLVSEGVLSGTVVVNAYRPKTHGNVIMFWGIQLHDDSKGPWREFAEDAGVSEVHYDGSAIEHIYDKALGTLTRSGSPPTGDWGTVEVGDLILFDVRNDGNNPSGPQWDEQWCQWSTVKRIGDDHTLEGLIGFNPDPDPDSGDSIWEHITIKIVKPPWAWTGEGYFGDQPNRGWWMQGFWENYQQGDTSSDVFTSKALAFPETSDITNIGARLFFANKLCFSYIYLPPPVEETDSGYCVIVELTEDGSPPTYTLDLDASLIRGTGKIFVCTVEHDFTLNITNAVCGQPVPVIIVQGAGGSHLMTLGSMCKLGTTVSSATLTTTADKRDYLGFMYYGPESQYDLVAFVKGYPA